MANNITNEIVIHSANAIEALDYMKSTDGTENGSLFDFNKIKPMPPELDIESSTDSAYAHIIYLLKNNLPILAHYKYQRYLKMNDVLNSYREKTHLIPLGEKIHNNWVKYNHPTWYEWCSEHWNTKWNAYNVSIKNNHTITFYSAWDAPLSIVEEWIGKFKLDCTYRSLCEGGIFWFIREYKDGVLVSNRYKIEEDFEPLYIYLRGYAPYDEEDENDE